MEFFYNDNKIIANHFIYLCKCIYNLFIYKFFSIFFFVFFRAEASAARLAELNPYVNIQTSTSSISKGDFGFLKHYQVQLWEAI